MFPHVDAYIFQWKHFSHKGMNVACVFMLFLGPVPGVHIGMPCRLGDVVCNVSGTKRLGRKVNDPIGASQQIPIDVNLFGK